MAKHRPSDRRPAVGCRFPRRRQLPRRHRRHGRQQCVESLLPHALQQQVLKSKASLDAPGAIQFGGALGGFARLPAVGEVSILIKPAPGDEVCVGLDVRVSAFLQIAIDHVLAFSLRTDPSTQTAKRETLGNAARILMELKQRGNWVRSCKHLRILTNKRRV